MPRHRPPRSDSRKLRSEQREVLLDDMDQTSQVKANQGATNGGDTDETFALTTYDDDQQPVPLASVPPSSPAGGVAFVPLPASLSLQAGGIAAAYAATVVPPPPALSNPHEIAFLQLQQQQQHRQEEKLQAFWAGQLAEAEQQQVAGGKVHHHSLPLARIKKIIKADQDVKMVAAEAPAVFARACEMFILELTLRAWLHAEGARRRTLQRADVTAAINGTETYDFLTDIVPPEEERSWSKGHDGVPPAAAAMTAVPVIVPPLTSCSFGPAPVTTAPFATYANMWPPLEHHHQQNSDGGRDQLE